MAREKITTPKVRLKSWDECDEALAEIGTLQSAIDADESQYNADEQRRRLDLTNKHKLSNERIASLVKDIKEFALHNRKEFDEKSKKKELKHGILSFRALPLSVSICAGKSSEDAVGLIRKSAKWLKLFLRQKWELDKSAIVGASKLYDEKSEKQPKGAISPAELAEFGLEVSGGETFNLKCKPAIS